MKKNWWDSKSLWVVIGIALLIAMEKFGITGETKYQVLALIGGKVGSQAWIDIKKK